MIDRRVQCAQLGVMNLTRTYFILLYAHYLYIVPVAKGNSDYTVIL